jgi:hypothetical protein
MSLILDGTNGLSDVDGSAATPAIRGSDANTGVFFGADQVGIATNGVERVEFGNSETVFNDGGANVDFRVEGDTDANLLFVDASADNVGIGTSSPAEKLHVNSGTGNVPLLLESTDALALAQFKDNSSTTFNAVGAQANALVFYNDTERARIDSSGNLSVGTTSNPVYGSTPARLNILKAAANYVINSTTALTTNEGHIAFRNPNGIVGEIATNGSLTSYNVSSDYRLKESIVPMTGALAKVALLKPCTYKWKVDGSDGQGFIAHELAEVEPGCVTGEKDAVDAEGNPRYQGIDTSFLVATLTAAIQELKGINDAQAQIITALTARVEALEGAQA